MNLVRVRHFMEEVGELARPKTPEERRASIVWSCVFLVGLGALYYYLYLS